MKSIKRSQKLISVILFVFIAGMAFLVYKIQKEASFYISNSDSQVIGNVYDRNGDVLFDGTGDYSKYEENHFLDVGNIIGDDMGQMTNKIGRAHV